jgi:3'-phosphoadenosine 5'-phosphosulfate sulfotransferase (PAPS reductase)/FAD synthetase
MKSAEVVDKISTTLNSFVEVVEANDVDSMYVLFSGGRDSLVALHLSKIVSEMLRLEIKALHVDTTTSTPGNLDYVREICEEFGVDLVVLRPKHDFFALVKKWGFPTATRRWCCYHLKIEPLKEFFMGVDTSRALLIDGIRAEESWRRREFPKLAWHRHFKCLNYHPIFEWTKEDVKSYIRMKNLRENPLYEKLPRVSECWCTAFKTIRQFQVLKREWPELFHKFVEAEAGLRTGGSALFKKGKRVYLKDL